MQHFPNVPNVCCNFFYIIHFPTVAVFEAKSKYQIICFLCSNFSAVSNCASREFYFLRATLHARLFTQCQPVEQKGNEKAISFSCLVIVNEL